MWSWELGHLGLLCGYRRERKEEAEWPATCVMNTDRICLRRGLRACHSQCARKGPNGATLSHKVSNSDLTCGIDLRCSFDAILGIKLSAHAYSYPSIVTPPHSLSISLALSHHVHNIIYARVYRYFINITLPHYDIMDPAAIAANLKASPQVLISGGLYMANLPWNNNITVLKAILAFTAVIGTLLNGFVASVILCHADRLTPPDINTAFKIDIAEFWQWVAFLCLVFLLLGVYGSRRIWLTGSSILCLLTFACAFARTGHQHSILLVLIGVLIATLSATALRLAYSCFSFGLINKRLLISSGLILYIGSFVAYLVGIESALMLSWKVSFILITAIGVVLLALSIICLPPDREWKILLEPFRMWE